MARSEDSQPGPVIKRSKKAIDVRAGMEPTKCFLGKNIDSIRRGLHTVEESALDSAQGQLPLTSEDVKSFEHFFARVEENLRRMKKDVYYRRAELLSEEAKSTPWSACSGHVYHDYHNA
jgi:hypothetical protein